MGRCARSLAGLGLGRSRAGAAAHGHAVEGFEALGMRGFAVAASVRRGQLNPSPTDVAIERRRALDELGALGVARPERMADMLAPGHWG